MDSSSVGSSTCTGWNRRSSAASFSIYLRYSSIVVAPITCTSPRASAGFKILDASSAPSAPPAPIIVCSSSINSSTFPAVSTSFITFLIRSSNSPRYLDFATSPDMSRDTRRLSATISGTFPFTRLCAIPSTIAVLPTPGSPIRHGLFLPLRHRIWITRSVSFSLPITGSNRPARAIAVRSREY